MKKLRIPSNIINPGDEGLRLESPWIVPEAAIFLANLLTGDEFVLDVGAGSSTLFFARRCRYVEAVETNKEWINKVLSVAYEHGLDKELEIKFAAGQVGVQDAISSIPFDKFYDIISIDTAWGFNRGDFLKLAIPKLKPTGILILDNYASEYMFPSTYMWTIEDTLKQLSMENTHAVHDFNNRGWQGKGTRIVCPK